jgi:hypothetical protein
MFILLKYGIDNQMYLHILCFNQMKRLEVIWSILLYKEEFEDTKGVISIRISKKNRQHNGQQKKYKRTNNDLQNIHIKLKIA